MKYAWHPLYLTSLTLTLTCAVLHGHAEQPGKPFRNAYNSDHFHLSIFRLTRALAVILSTLITSFHLLFICWHTHCSSRPVSIYSCMWCNYPINLPPPPSTHGIASSSGHMPQPYWPSLLHVIIYYTILHVCHYLLHSHSHSIINFISSHPGTVHIMWMPPPPPIVRDYFHFHS